MKLYCNIYNTREKDTHEEGDGGDGSEEDTKPADEQRADLTQSDEGQRHVQPAVDHGETEHHQRAGVVCPADARIVAQLNRP